MGMQAGADFTLPVGLFSKLSVQYTKLDPFFYTHYTHINGFLHPIYQNVPYDPENPEDFYTKLETAYVNKGENLGYPLHPNSDELLVKANIGIGVGWESIITVKYQRRSGQYGFRIDMPVPLGYEDIELYDDKDFSGFIFEKNLFVECKIVKQLNKLPFRVYGSYRFDLSVDREFIGSSPGSDVNSDYNYTYAEEWNELVYSHALQIGFSLYK